MVPDFSDGLTIYSSLKMIILQNTSIDEKNHKER